MKLSQWRGCTYLGLSSLWRPIWQMKIFSNSWNNLKSSFLLSPEFSTLFTIPRYTHTLRWMNLCALLLIIALILFTARWVDLLHAWMCRCVFMGRENTLSINIEFTIEALWALLACVKVRGRTFRLFWGIHQPSICVFQIDCNFLAGYPKNCVRVFILLLSTVIQVQTKNPY